MNIISSFPGNKLFKDTTRISIVVENEESLLKSNQIELFH